MAIWFSQLQTNKEKLNSFFPYLFTDLFASNYIIYTTHIIPAAMIFFLLSFQDKYTFLHYTDMLRREGTHIYLRGLMPTSSSRFRFKWESLFHIGSKENLHNVQSVFLSFQDLKHFKQSLLISVFFLKKCCLLKSVSVYINLTQTLNKHKFPSAS